MRRAFRILAALVALIGFGWSQAHAQVPLTGAGRGAPAVAGGVVTVDQVATAPVLSASGTSVNFTNQTITVGLSNSALVVFLTQSTTAIVTGMTVTWDSGGTNQSMTQVSTLATANGQVWIFARLAPTAGNKTLAVSWTGTGQIFVDSFSLSGVNQTNIATAFVHSASSSTGTAPSITVTSQANNLVANVWASLGTFSGAFSGTGIYFNNGGAVWDAAASYDPGAASVTATATATATNWVGASIDVVHN